MNDKTLIEILKNRFEANMKRHQTIAWETIATLISTNQTLLMSLSYMETSGGEPDVCMLGGQWVYTDFSEESPQGRRSACYDQKALQERKKNPPLYDAQTMVEAYNATLLSVEEYHELQKIAVMDTKTSSWLQTPLKIRQRGGAIFGDNRYDTVFIYHNGADSYYAARGFRMKVKLSIQST